MRSGRLARRNQKKKPESSSKSTNDETRKSTPQDPIKPSLESRRGLIQQQIAGAENLADLYLFEFRNQIASLLFGVRLRSGTFKVLVNGLAQGFSSPCSIAQPQHDSRERRVMVNHYAQLPPGLQNAARFLYAARGLGTVVHDTIRVHQIE